MSVELPTALGAAGLGLAVAALTVQCAPDPGELLMAEPGGRRHELTAGEMTAAAAALALGAGAALLARRPLPLVVAALAAAVTVAALETLHFMEVDTDGRIRVPVLADRPCCEGCGGGGQCQG